MRNQTAQGSTTSPAPAKKTRATKVAEALRRSILRGEMEPGAKISLDQLRDHYKVSLSPMREAVSRLANVGLVEFEDQRGYSVAPVSRGNLREVIELRATLECRALAECISKATLDWESEVLGALHRLTRIAFDPAAPDTIDAWEDAHRRFHLALVAGCDMPMLIDFCTMLYDLNERYRRLYAGPVADGEAMMKDHRGIADAAVARDADLAAKRLHAHIEGAGQELQKRMAGLTAPSLGASS